MIVILAPYGRNEVTAAAIRLADLALSLGLDTRLVACELHERQVHPFWDSKVWSGKGDGVYRAAKGCTCVVHFMCQPSYVEKVRLVAEKSKQILVPLWHSLRPQDINFIPQYDQVVCPSKTCYDLLKKAAFRNEENVQKLTWAKWEAGLPSVRREGTVDDATIKACFYCDASAIDFCGPLVIEAVSELLAMCKRLSATMISTKAWAKRDRQQLKHAGQIWGGRLRMLKVSGLVQQAGLFHAHDWSVFMGVRADFGINAQRSLACGAPCIAFNVEPYNELIAEGRNGVLIPCEVHYNANHAPVAVPSMGSILSTCGPALADQRKLFSIQQGDWHMNEHRHQFNELWSAVWTG